MWDEIIFLRTCEIRLAFNHGIEIIGLEEVMGAKTAGYLAVCASSFLGRNSLVYLSLRPGPPVGPDGRCGSSNHPTLSLEETSLVLRIAIASEAREVPVSTSSGSHLNL